MTETVEYMDDRVYDFFSLFGLCFLVLPGREVTVACLERATLTMLGGCLERPWLELTRAPSHLSSPPPTAYLGTRTHGEDKMTIHN